MFLRLAQEPPRTLNKEWEHAATERAKEQKMNPITGTFEGPYYTAYTNACLQVSRRKIIKAKALFNTNRILYRIEHVDIPYHAVSFIHRASHFLFVLYDMMARG